MRLFIQEYYGISVSSGVYNWTLLDAQITDMLAIGTIPLINICFKPAWMFGTINHTTVAPSSWTDWNTLVTALVNHVSSTFGLTGLYWEVMNEPDLGESGGCPYLFNTDGVAYQAMFSNTRTAIMAWLINEIGEGESLRRLLNVPVLGVPKCPPVPTFRKSRR